MSNSDEMVTVLYEDIMRVKKDVIVAHDLIVTKNRQRKKLTVDETLSVLCFLRCAVSLLDEYSMHHKSSLKELEILMGQVDSNTVN